jgi:hypothetical protein
VPALTYAAFMVARIIPYTATLRVVPIGTLHILHVIRCMEVFLPAAVLWGMSFPLALAAATSANTDRAARAARVRQHTRAIAVR